MLEPAFATAECLEGLAGFSHLWLVFVFHATASQGWQASVRPPRLGGNERLGVFATRSMFRPNPVGLSVVELMEIVDGANGKEIILRGADLLDGTPVLDIKPYVPYADSIPSALGGFAATAPVPTPVIWSEQALTDRDSFSLSADFCALIDEVLAQDPRPAYRGRNDDAHEYGMALGNINLRFAVVGGVFRVLSVKLA